MAKKRIDAADHGISVSAILEEIKPHLSGTQTAIAEQAGMRQSYLSDLLRGRQEPSLAALAALAEASGGRLELKYHPPKKRKR